MSIDALLALRSPEAPTDVDAGKRYVNLPNAISMAGFVAGLAYLRGAHPVWAIASIAADEIDGYIARGIDDASEFGGNLDWAIDLTLNGAFAVTTGTLIPLPIITAARAYVRTRSWKTPLLSPRAILMLYSIYKFGWKPLPKFGIVEKEDAP